MTILTPPRVLREKLGEDGVDALIDLVNRSNDKRKEDVLVFVEEKFERRLTEVKSDLEVKIEKVRFDIVKWMFVFLVGQTGILVGLILALNK